MFKFVLTFVDLKIIGSSLILSSDDKFENKLKILYINNVEVRIIVIISLH